MHQDTAKAMDENAAAVFSSDLLYIEKDKDILSGYIERWQREMKKVASAEDGERSFSTVLFKTDTPNRNGMLIPKSVILEAVEKFFSDGEKKPVFFGSSPSTVVAWAHSFKDVPGGIDFSFSVATGCEGLMSSIHSPDIRPTVVVSEMIDKNITKIEKILSLHMDDKIVLL